MGIKRVPTYFNEFACIGGACEDNCCIGWEVDIDDESLEVYNSVGGEFGDRLRRYMNDENSFTLDTEHLQEAAIVSCLVQTS